MSNLSFSSRAWSLGWTRRACPGEIGFEGPRCSRTPFKSGSRSLRISISILKSSYIGGLLSVNIRGFESITWNKRKGFENSTCSGCGACTWLLSTTFNIKESESIFGLDRTSSGANKPRIADHIHQLLMQMKGMKEGGNPSDRVGGHCALSPKSVV